MNRKHARRNPPHAQTSLCCHASALLSLLAVIALCGCKRSVGDAIAPPAPPMNVEIVAPKRGEINRSITLPTYRLLPYQEATLYAKVPGYLKTITVDKGDQVKEGQLLAEIEVPEMMADRAKCRAEAEVAQLDYTRVREAQKKAPDLVVVQTVDAMKAKYDVATANLERVELFDVFRGQHVPAGRKSMAYAFIYRHAERTLTDAEVNAAHEKLAEQLRQKLQATIR